MSNQTEWWAPVKSDESVTQLFGGDRSAGAPGAPEPRRRSRASGRKREERLRKQRRRRTISVLVVALILVAGAGYVVYSLMGGSLFGGSAQSKEVTDYPGPGRPGAPTVVINAGDSGAAIATTLYSAGIVASEGAFREAFDNNPDAAGIQPGSYQLLLEMKAEDAVRALLDPKSRVSMKVTIPEGFSAEDIYTRINKVTLIPVEELRAAAEGDPAAIGLPAEAGGKIEGWLFPSTYQVEPNTSAAAVLAPMVAKTVETLTAKGVPQDQWQAVLTKASLVEREAKMHEDRPIMARAIENRLDRGMTLDIDASVAYGLGISGTQLTRENTQDPSNPYNTYKHLGLPPTPIASPGAVSIDAVLSPAPGNWVFWVAIDLETGETRFAETYDEHQENVALLRQWQAEHSG